MLRAKQIPLALDVVNYDGITASLLLQRDGALLGSAGEGLAELDDRIVSAIVSNIWTEFEVCGKDNIKGGGLKVMLLQLEKGRLGVASTGGEYLVCVYAQESVKFGLIKAKLEALQRYFDDQMSQIEPL
ncbi:hypothetical protein JKP88DRAFT_224090 [Tribonema minus]|uniref:Roadblock/LAMTOR2 domain-containing protein n=1 Tax=Tribonema minus TaxID=303371 RepID=A0A835YQ72_9STRA|nr:hypothetical protein JKP88DRAFT_224090 [Tribonema minus]